MWVTQSLRWVLRVGSDTANGRFPRKIRVTPWGLFLQGLFLSFGSSLTLLVVVSSWDSFVLSFWGSSSSLVAAFSSSSSSWLSSMLVCFFFLRFFSSSSSSPSDSAPFSFDSLFLFLSLSLSFFFFFFSLFGSSSSSLFRSDLDNFTIPSELNDTLSSFSNSLTADLNNFLDDLSTSASAAPSAVSTAVRNSLRSIDLPFLEERMVAMMEVAREDDESSSMDLFLPMLLFDVA
mmetsp:Transcript_20064/g.43520  ORF Transcript_20064/g.43520 Transcript_20064/m.43520 type:complete len:233 (+) Transcript_20064:588-1286(+)